MLLILAFLVSITIVALLWTAIVALTGFEKWRMLILPWTVVGGCWLLWWLG